jgi:hypothetical protein
VFNSIVKDLDAKDTARRHMTADIARGDDVVSSLSTRSADAGVAHGGKIRADSRPRVGTTIVFSLPR